MIGTKSLGCGATVGIGGNGMSSGFLTLIRSILFLDLDKIDKKIVYGM